MSAATHDVLLAPFEEVVDEHACSYGERILKLEKLRGLGSHGLTAYELSSLAGELARLHSDSGCPSTHIDDSPTKEWSDWVRATKL